MNHVTEFAVTTQLTPQSTGLLLDTYVPTKRSGGGAHASHPTMQVTVSGPHIPPIEVAAQDTHEDQPLLSM